MKISVFGLGYAGLVSAACLARDRRVIGVDTDRAKVDLVNAGRSPIAEPRLDDLIASAVQAGLLNASLDGVTAVRDSDISFISVGTPSHEDGSLNLDYVREASRRIGQGLRIRGGYHVVVARSAMLPGAMESVVIPIIEQVSGKRAGRNFGACVNPEFLREGTAIYDFDHPPKIVIGAIDDRSARALKALYARPDAPLVVTQLGVAEAIKYADNAWHAVKVDFANEIGAVCDAAGVDGHAVMNVFAMDEKLNISRASARARPRPQRFLHLVLPGGPAPVHLDNLGGTSECAGLIAGIRTSHSGGLFRLGRHHARLRIACLVALRRSIFGCVSSAIVRQSGRQRRDQTISVVPNRETVLGQPR